MQTRGILALPLFLLALGAGCAKESRVEFEPNMVFAHGLQLRDDLPMAEPLKQTQIILEELFGTPDAPKLPEFITSNENYASLISLDNLHLAAGQPTQDGGGVYRRLLCSSCHGIGGGGRGPTAALLDPYPRDYRNGLFKYKSTAGNSKPTREDLARVIKEGIAGTSMIKVVDMVDADIAPLVDYVIYLSWRGQLERSMLIEAEDLFATEIEAALAIEEAANAENEDSELEPSETTQLSDQELADLVAERDAWIQELTLEIADTWIAANDNIFTVPARPADFPVPDSINDVVAASADQPSPLTKSIAQGREIFASELAACTKCHGKEGHGDGIGQYYDTWTEGWTTQMGIDPTDEEAVTPLIARGALPPKLIYPRDFRSGIFRGGDTPEDLFRRIAAGINGTPMPAAKLTDQQIWHLVNFVRSMRIETEETAP